MGKSYILSLAKALDKLKSKKGLNLLDKEKMSIQKLYNTANQNNSVVNSY